MRSRYCHSKTNPFTEFPVTLANLPETLFILVSLNILLIRTVVMLRLLLAWLDNLTDEIGASNRITFLNLNIGNLSGMWCRDDHFLHEISNNSFNRSELLLPFSWHSTQLVDHPS